MGAILSHGGGEREAMEGKEGDRDRVAIIELKEERKHKQHEAE